MATLSRAEQAKADVLMNEICLLNESMEGKPLSEKDRSNLLTERKLLIRKLNRIYGTEHMLEDSKITIE